MIGGRARKTAFAIAGSVVLTVGLGACITPTTPTTPTCTAPTPIIAGFPPATTTGPVPGWYSGDTRAHGSVRVDSTYSAPDGFGCNAAVFTTGDSAGGLDKAQLADFDMAGTPLSAINNISYQAYRSSLSAPGSVAHLAFNVAVSNLVTSATLVYEPYLQSGGAAAIQDNTWQAWPASSGVWWTPEIASGPGSQSSPQPWTFFQTTYGSGWFVVAYGLDIGSSNPNMVVAGDDIVFGPTTVDF